MVGVMVTAMDMDMDMVMATVIANTGLTGFEPFTPRLDLMKEPLSGLFLFLFSEKAPLRGFLHAVFGRLSCQFPTQFVAQSF